VNIAATSTIAARLVAISRRGISEFMVSAS
jgi:hypothetical protein